jgi:hypothetical protein
VDFAGDPAAIERGAVRSSPISLAIVAFAFGFGERRFLRAPACCSLLRPSASIRSCAFSCSSLSASIFPVGPWLRAGFCAPQPELTGAAASAAVRRMRDAARRGHMWRS